MYSLYHKILDSVLDTVVARDLRCQLTKSDFATPSGSRGTTTFPVGLALPLCVRKAQLLTPDLLQLPCGCGQRETPSRAEEAKEEPPRQLRGSALKHGSQSQRQRRYSGHENPGTMGILRRNASNYHVFTLIRQNQVSDNMRNHGRAGNICGKKDHARINFP